MRTKIMKAVGAAAAWIPRILDVRLPMAALYGLRTR
jgi:hypothetical protein